MRYSGDYDFYSGEEIAGLVRAAANERDAAVYLTAAMTGLRRGELVALRWRDVDFPGQALRVRANYSHGELVKLLGRALQPSPVRGIMTCRLEPHQRCAGPDVGGCFETVAPRKGTARHVEMMLGLVDQWCQDALWSNYEARLGVGSGAGRKDRGSLKPSGDSTGNDQGRC